MGESVIEEKLFQLIRDEWKTRFSEIRALALHLKATTLAQKSGESVSEISATPERGYCRAPDNYNNPETKSVVLISQPEFLRCKCGREEALRDLFDCKTCIEYGFCGLCFARKHRTHEITDCMPNVLLNLVTERSHKTLNKLRVWSQHVAKIIKMSSEAHAELCGRLGLLFKNSAMSGELTHVEQALANCDISVLEECINNLLEAHIIVIERMKEFSDRLPIGERSKSNVDEEFI